MVDPWEKAYVYGLDKPSGKVAHILTVRNGLLHALCKARGHLANHTPDPYPVCKNCLRTKRAKELGL